MKRNTITLFGAVAAMAVVSLGLATSTGSAQTATPGATGTVTTTAAAITGTPATTSTPAALPTLASTATTSTAEPSAGTTPTATTEAAGTDEASGTASTGIAFGTITVDGIGSSSAAPDSAVVEIGVQSRAVTASIALSQTSTQVQALIETLQGAGVAESDIQTQFVNLFPAYDQPQTPGGEQTLSGFNATNIVSVRVRDLSQLGDLLDTAVTAGANIVQSVRLELSDADSALSDARAAAVTNARTKAEQLATLAGKQLGDIRVIVESSLAAPVLARDGFGGGAASVPIAPGTQNVQVVVQVTWELR